VDRARYFWNLKWNLMSPAFRRAVKACSKWLAHAYVHLAETAGVTTLIDSSKNPATVPMLAGVPGIDLQVVHVVRDLRGVIHSWRKHKFNPGAGANMPRWSAWQTMMTWSVQNLACQSLSSMASYHLLRYEDFAASPRTRIQKLVSGIEPVKQQVVPFVDETSLELPMVHSVSGNPDRFSIGRTSIRPDIAWREGLDAGTRRLATAFGYPLLRRFGYLS